MTYMTIRATVRQGKVELLDEIVLPEDAALLITILDDDVFDHYTLADHLVTGLQDVLAGRTTEITTEEELKAHLDTILAEP
jgi:hypothetical protein